MTPELTDKTGEQVTIELDDRRPVSAYTVHLADGTLAGRADFIDAPGSDAGRIFFHTEVEPELSGRGLGGILVRAALADSVAKDITIVPVCPLVAAHLERHGAQLLADGGRFRQPTHADIDLVRTVIARNA